jgi:hypothetical protein
MNILNEKELNEMGLSTVDCIEFKWGDILKGKRNVALVCVIDERTNGEGYLLGLATKGERGYKSLGIVINEHNYNIANKYVDEANKRIFERSEEDTFMIVLSSMR